MEEYQSLQRKVRRLEAQLDVYSVHGSPGSFDSWSSVSRTPGSSLNDIEDADLAPSVFFLDGYSFLAGKCRKASPSVQLPQVFEDVCPTITTIQRILGYYFTNTHAWLPIVSRARMHNDLSLPLDKISRDLALLYPCMRLIGERLPQALQNPQTSYYLSVKEYFFFVESAGFLSVNLLQAGILLVFYEFGHAIFPAAFTTIGRCAKMGQAMGIHHGASAPQMLGGPASWSQMEERSRVWWAVLLLDRQVASGNTSLPFSVHDPNPEDFLPFTEARWNEGDMGTNEPLFVSSPFDMPVCRYARLCQTSYLMGKILQHVNNQILDDGSRFQEAIQLNRLLQSLSVVISNELNDESNMVLHSSMALCYSGMMILNKPCSGIEPVGLTAGLVIPAEFQNHALATLRLAARETNGFAVRLRVHLSGLSDRTSPFIANCLYQAATLYSWFVRDMPGNFEILKAIDTFKETLRKLDKRWKIAGI